MSVSSWDGHSGVEFVLDQAIHRTYMYLTMALRSLFVLLATFIACNANLKGKY